MALGIKEVVIGATAQGASREQGRVVRRAVLGLAQLLRDPQGTREMFQGIASLEEAVDGLLASHIDPATIADGAGGTFDVCDLRHWLVIAEKAGVQHVLAREILTLSSDEVSTLLRPIQVPGKFRDAIRRRAAKIFGDQSSPAPAPQPDPDRMDILERIYAAGDLIPPGHVVRSAICGPSTMKALAGTGTLSHSDDAARFGDMAIGCGWVRDGNRTRIDVTDSRIVSLQATGHEDTFRFLVRPWIEASRRVAGQDPHFAGTPLGGERSWPAEWRVFIENGQVKGVGNYYAWAGEIGEEAARGALAAKAAAEKMLEEMQRSALLPVFTDLFMLGVTSEKNSMQTSKAMEQATEVLARFPLDGIHCTLDFIETGDGEVTLLEGGPAHTHIGGAHPTAFCGCLEREDSPVLANISGVAFRQKDGVFLPEPKTWSVQPCDHALDFEAVELIAFGQSCEP